MSGWEPSGSGASNDPDVPGWIVLFVLLSIFALGFGVTFGGLRGAAYALSGVLTVAGFTRLLRSRTVTMSEAGDYWIRRFYDNSGYERKFERIEFDDPVGAAAKRGLVVETPAVDELFLDLDSRAHRNICLLRIGLLLKAGISVSIMSMRQSRNSHWWAPRYHARLRFTRTLTDAERIAWQAALGSDATRELLSLARLEKGVVPATCLFETEPTPKAQTIDRAMVLE